MKETKELLHVVCVLADAIVEAKKDDDTIDITDLANLIPVIKPVLEGVDGISKISDEFKNIDKAGYLTLCDEVWEVKDKITLVINTLKTPELKAALLNNAC